RTARRGRLLSRGRRCISVRAGGGSRVRAMTTVRHHAFVFALASWLVAVARALAVVQATASTQNQQNRQDLPRFTSSESVRRVVLYATVRGEDGFVADLTADCLHVFSHG